MKSIKQAPYNKRFKSDAGRVRWKACGQRNYSVTSTKTENLRRLNAGSLGILKMPKLIILFLLVFSFACTESKEDFDTSPFSDPELIPYTPFDDLIDAVIVFQKKYREMPNDFSSLQKLTRQDYIAVCITDGIEDSILVDDTHLNFFSESESTFKTIPSGLEIHFLSKDSTYTIWGEWSESLYSTDFDAYTFATFDISILIENGKGILKIDFESNQTKIFIEELTGNYGLSPAQKFHIVDEQIVLENSEPLCFEE